MIHNEGGNFLCGVAAFLLGEGRVELPWGLEFRVGLQDLGVM